MALPTIIIRSAQPSDLDGIMQVENDAFIPGIREKSAVFKERIRVCTDSFIVFEDTRNGTAAGYFSAELWNSIPENDSLFTLGHSAGDSFCSGGSVLYLSSFALRSAYRGNGTGKKLFASSLAWFCSHNPQVKTLLLLVNSEWQGALHIYQSAGFTELRRIPHFFASVHDGLFSDGIIMTKEISGVRHD